MQTNKKVEAVAEVIMMMSPNFSMSKSYSIAYEAVKAIENINDNSASEPTG